MRRSNKFSLDQTLGTLFGNRDKDLMRFVRRSLKLKHQDLILEKHTPHMKDVRKILKPRESYVERVRKLEDCHSEGHQLSINESVVNPGKFEN